MRRIRLFMKPVEEIRPMTRSKLYAYRLSVSLVSARWRRMMTAPDRVQMRMGVMKASRRSLVLVAGSRSVMARLEFVLE